VCMLARIESERECLHSCGRACACARVCVCVFAESGTDHDAFLHRRTEGRLYTLLLQIIAATAQR
jgi:hypothetical protein